MSPPLCTAMGGAVGPSGWRTTMNRALAEVLVVRGCGRWLSKVVVLVAQRLRVEPSPDGGYATGRERRIGLGDVKAAAVRWTTTTNHREIGLLYIAFGTVAAIWGGIDAMMIRTHLLTPEANLWTEQTYNELFTMHGLTMLIFFVTPVFSGSGTTFCRC